MAASPRTSAKNDDRFRGRKDMAGRVGFVLGIVAFAIAATINLSRAPRPFTPMIVLLAVLMAALNIPLGIAFGLLGERMSRPRD